MNKIKLKAISALLIICIILGNVQMVRADTLDITPFEIYTNEEEGYTLTRIIDKTKVTVLVKSLDGSVEHIIVNDNGKLYLDEYLIKESIYDTSNLADDFNGKISNLTSTSSISWGNWQYTDLDPIPTGGLTTAIIASMIAAAAPWVALRVIAAVVSVVAGKYDEVQIEMRVRYGEDDRYFYYERDTWFYGDGNYISGPHRDSGREPL